MKVVVRSKDLARVLSVETVTVRFESFPFITDVFATPRMDYDFQPTEQWVITHGPTGFRLPGRPANSIDEAVASTEAELHHRGVTEDEWKRQCEANLERMRNECNTNSERKTGQSARPGSPRHSD